MNVRSPVMLTIRVALATLALGVGLMALVFISNRRGYDEIGRRDV